MMDKLDLYLDILRVAADDVWELRPADVDRVLEEAADRGCRAGFRAWLLAWGADHLLPRTRQALERAP